MAAAHPNAPIRRTIYFTGNVQGVGFRYTTQSIASKFAVTGFVRNLSDGRVEAVVEGAEPELDRFLRAIERDMSRHIREVLAHDMPASGEFEAFEIRL